jgi:hypothetical protein
MRVIVEQLVEWRLAGETEVLGENLPPTPLCPPQIPHNQTRARTRAAAVGSQRLTAWAMARPIPVYVYQMVKSETPISPIISWIKIWEFSAALFCDT